MSRRKRLQRELDDIEMEQAELTEKQKKLERKIHNAKKGDHTERSYRKLQRFKNELQDVQVRKAELKKKKKKVQHKLRDLSTSTTEELEEKIDELVGENADIREHRDQLLEEVKRLRDIRDAAKEVVSKMQAVGIPRVARAVDEDKNIFSTTGASLWTGDIQDINDKYEKLREVL